MNRGLLLRGLAVALLLALGGWLATALEWTEVDVRQRARGEAEHNPLYATQQLLRQLGVAVTVNRSLDPLPPADARLVLSSRHWQLLPGRKAQLRQWVEQGGQLVLPSSVATDPGFSDWLPVQRRELQSCRRPTAKPGAPAAGDDAAGTDAADDEDEDEDAAPSIAPPPRPPVRAGGTATQRCAVLTEAGAAAPSYAGGQTFRVCNFMSWMRVVPSRDEPPVWSVNGALGPEVLRVAVGRGTVTTLAGWPMLNNAEVLDADHALLAMAVLQARPGAAVWFVGEESRTPFLRWLWEQGWAAIVLGLAALTAALWRGAVRFGPIVQAAGTARRSMAEQVRGTAQFLQQHGRSALHAAQRRALDDMAARQLHGYRPLVPALRAEAIARATALPAAALRDAMAARTRRPAELAADLELMESARRRLEANGPFPSTASAPHGGDGPPPSLP